MIKHSRMKKRHTRELIDYYCQKLSFVVCMHIAYPRVWHNTEMPKESRANSFRLKFQALINFGSSVAFQMTSFLEADVVGLIFYTARGRFSFQRNIHVLCAHASHHRSRTPTDDLARVATAANAGWRFGRKKMIRP